MYSRVVIAAALPLLVFAAAGYTEPMPGHNEPGPQRLPNGASLAFNRTVTLRGLLGFGRTRKLPPLPEESFSGYTLTTQATYTISIPVTPRETYVRTGVCKFWVKAPREVSLLWYRNREVEISGRLLPEGHFHTPTLVVDFIHVVREQPKHPTNRSSQPLAVATSTFDSMKHFPMFATLAAASGGSAPSR